MRISTKGRYSLAALLYLATLEDGVYANSKEIAAAAETTEGYIEQLFIQLRKIKLIEGIRGRNGGYTLAVPCEKIRIGDILRACEGSLKPSICVDARVCPAEKKCLSKNAWLSLYKAINSCIDSITLRDLLNDYKARENPGYII
ncbi:MAG: Rrf2 family transcriptional regulator [Spirochaetaceae bacterium]|jgi:Rrf2 family protein|nr:Rrf2 family transcriptional regulator [Spirochaetaceae bacterium]